MPDENDDKTEFEKSVDEIQERMMEQSGKPVSRKRALKERLGRL